MAERRILRYEVPVDDQWHIIDLSPGPILHVGCRQRGVVEFWHIDRDGERTPRAFMVCGTGQPLAPAVGGHIGTVVDAGGHFIWHLMEHVVPGRPEADRAH